MLGAVSSFEGNNHFTILPQEGFIGTLYFNAIDESRLKNIDGAKLKK